MSTPWWRELVPTPLAAAIALFVCVVAPVVLVALQIDRNPKFSPVDEAAHYDYVNRVAEGELPRQGQHLMRSTMREVACKGNAFSAVPVPPCSTPVLRYDQFAGGAQQYEALHPPVYHAITVPFRWVIQHTLVSDRLDATRAVGILWLVAGLLLLWAAGRVMGIAPANLGAVLLLLVTAPTVVFFYGTVTTDATALTTGGLVALAAAIAWRRENGAPWLLLAAGVFAAACKVTNMFAVVTVSGAFLVAAIAGRAAAEPWTATARRWLRDGGVLLAGGVVTSILWVIIHDAIALVDLTDEPALEGLRGGSQSFGGVLVVATKFFQPLTDQVFSAATLGQDAQQPFRTALAFLLIGGGLGGLFVSPRTWAHVLGLISVPALYFGGVAIGLGFIVGFGTDAGAGVSGRYAMSVAPLILLALAASLRGRWPVGAVATLAVSSFAVTLAVLAT
jgi:hypothetical protein